MSRIQIRIENIGFSPMAKERRPTVKLELSLTGGKIIEEMQGINSHNAQATNERFDKLEAANKQMKLDLDNAIVTFSKSKKSSWFGRK